MIIRRATLGDISEIAKVNIQSWEETYRGIMPDSILDNRSLEKSILGWTKTISNSENINLVVTNENNEVIGFCSGGFNRDENFHKDYPYELMAIYILRKYHKKGIGKKLVQYFMQEVYNRKFASMIVCVLAQNSALNFYKRLGAKIIGKKSYNFGCKELEGIVLGWENFDMLRK
jgi:ribosomal protein S18 acetylase RimI-like enzyme